MANVVQLIPCSTPCRIILLGDLAEYPDLDKVTWDDIDLALCPVIGWALMDDGCIHPIGTALSPVGDAEGHDDFAIIFDHNNDLIYVMDDDVGTSRELVLFRRIADERARRAEAKPQSADPG